jgi:D-alanyl-D-alanine carboxypeptidase (penicillin-binding protein 5/6)
MRWRWWARLGIALGLLGREALTAPVALGSPASILIDAHTGQSLLEENADAPIPVGPLSQLMVLLLSLEQATLGVVRLDAAVTAPDTAAEHVVPADGGKRSKTPRLGPTQIVLQAGKAYVLADLLKALVISSSDSASVAAAQAIAGSVPACLELMNARAQRLGMKGTHYSTIAGPAATSDFTTARDIALLAQALVVYPQVLQWASLNGLPFDHGAILLRNANQLIGSVPGVDGLHVSSSRDAGNHIVATAQQRSLRLIAVVLGAADSATRYARAADLLEWGFAHYERLAVVKKGEHLNLPIPVMHGTVAQITPVAGQTFSLLSRRGEERNFQVRYQLPTVLMAPLKRHQQIGELIVEEQGKVIAVIPVLSPKTVAATGMLSAAVP